MSLVIDANMKLFAERMNITSSRMIQDYGLKSVDEIIEAEAAQGNSQAVKFAQEMYNSPAKLIKIFKLTDVENKFVLLHNMNAETREKILPMLDSDDLVMGLYFFTQDKLLEMLEGVDIEELVRVVLGAFPLADIVSMFTEDDLAQFFQHDELERKDVIEQLKCMPPEVMIKFVEGVTGQPSEETDPMELINSIANLPMDQYRDFMSAIDPDVQRQLTFQLTKEKPEYLQLFPNQTYINMLSTMMKPDMVKPMINLNKESLVTMITELPADLMSIVAAQVDTQKFAEYILDGHTDLLEGALMI